jgi:hypothetical protein
VLTPREQGNLGEYSAVEWFISNGIPVAIPIGHTPDWDLLAEINGRAVRVQGEDDRVLPQRALGSAGLHTRREPELEPDRQEARCVAM